jgi:hypothetical protein
LEESFDGGAVVVALLGHNQTINTGERGAIAWLEAAVRRGWEYAIGEDTFALSEFGPHEEFRSHPLRRRLESGHLAESLRFYRNSKLELWAHAVLEDDPLTAKAIAAELDAEAHTVWLTRSLADARRWVREHRIGDERMGLVASAQGRRLSAEGIHVQYKPEIAPWMLKPSGDVRSSNMLETAQNQSQIQGLELDHVILCWDADLRRDKDGWAAYKVSGGGWKKDKALDIAKCGYRVLLTRARKSMILFVPKGDQEDPTRPPELYDTIADHLLRCGARVFEG